MGFLKKFLSSQRDNLLARVLFQQIGNGQIIWTEKDLEKYVDEFHDGNTDLFTVIDYVTNGFNRLNFVVRDKAGELVESGPLYDRLQFPNPSQSWDEWASTYLKFKLVTGNSYIWRIPTTGDPVHEMWVLPAQFTEVVSGGWARPARGYKIALNNGWNKEFKGEEVLHIKEVNLNYEDGNVLYGMSRLKPGSKTVDTNTMAQNASAHRFHNNGADAIISVKGIENAQEGRKFSQDLKNQVKKDLTGVENSGAVSVTGKEIQVHKLGVSAVDLGIFLYQRVFLGHGCVGVFGVGHVDVNDAIQQT